MYVYFVITPRSYYNKYIQTVIGHQNHVYGNHFSTARLLNSKND